MIGKEDKFDSKNIKKLSLDELKKRKAYFKEIYNIRRPKPPFFIFCEKFREYVLQKGRKEKYTAKQLGSIWKKLPDTDKEKYKKIYEKNMKNYENYIENLVIRKYYEEDETDIIEDSDTESIKNLNTKHKKAKAKADKKDMVKDLLVACNCGKCESCKLCKLNKVTQKNRNLSSDND